VGLAEQRLANQADGDAGACRLDRGAEPGPAGADDEHVIAVGGVRRHQKILQSVRTPIEQSRTYRSAPATEKRLAHAHR
jgi:hypothetical protein